MSSYPDYGRYCLLVGLLVVLASAAQAESTHNDIQYLNTALVSLSSGEVEKTLTELSAKNDTALCPEHRSQHLGVACKALLAKGDAAAASTACARAIELHDSRRNWRYYNNLGIAYFQLGDDEAAAEAFSEAVLRSGMTVTPRKNLEAIQRVSQSDISRVEVGEALQAR